MKKYKGFSLIELLITLFIVIVMSGAAFALYFVTTNGSVNEKNLQQALLYAREGLELSRNFKYGNFLNLVDGDYAWQREGDSYVLIPDQQETLENFFRRQVSISSVFRNASGQIDENGTLLDGNTKKITVTINWTDGFSIDKSLVLQEYLSDWEGTTWTQTTVTDFNQGVNGNTAVLASDPNIIADNGKVELSQLLNELTYSQTVNVFAAAKGVFFKDNIIYVAVKKEEGGLCAVNFADPQYPVLLDCADLDEKGNAVIVVENLAYVGMDDDDGLAIVDVSNPADLQVLSILETDDNVDDLDIQGNHVYMAVKDNKKGLVIANVSNPNHPFVSARISTGDNGTGIAISGSLAYLLADNELRIYDIANVNNPLLRGKTPLPDTGQGIAIGDSYAYVIGGPGSSNTLHVLNVSNPYLPFLLSSYDVGASGEAVAINDGVLYVAVNDNAAGLRTFDINPPQTPVLLDSVNIQGKGQDVFVTDGYVFLAVDTADQGLAIVSMSSDELALEGEYVSKIHDTGLINPDLKYFTVLANDSPGGDVNFQLRSAAAASEIDTATFVGPDGSASSFYADFPALITLDPLRNGSQFLQWKAFFSGNGLSTPSLEEVTIKYE